MTLAATKRDERGKKVRKLREAGMVPSIVYGTKSEPLAISVPHKDFSKLFADAGESTVIVLKGLDRDREVLVQEVAFDPVSGNPLHVDFFEVDQAATLSVTVPLEFVGEAPAVKTGGAVLTKVLHEIEVECLPKNIPQHIEVSVAGLAAIDDTIHVKDLPKLSGVEYQADPEDVVVIASALVEETEESTTVDMASVEVEKKGKKDEESEA